MNQRPPDPQSGALTRLRHAPMCFQKWMRNVVDLALFYKRNQLDNCLLQLAHGFDIDIRRGQWR